MSHFMIIDNLEGVFMKIAVTYENGEVFQHFGHSKSFKIYEISDGKVTSDEIIDAAASGHDAMAAFLDEKGVDAVICGGLGDGAKNALVEAGIEVVSGVKGNADEAVEEYLAGNLISEGVNCHHHDEGGCCCGHDEGGCGCGGGCGCHTPEFDGENVGKTVKVHYQGTLDDGTQFDSSYDRGQPLEFVCGAGMMILGFDKAVANMKPGEIVNVHLMPEEAYGERDESAVITLDIDQVPGSEDLTKGQKLYLQNPRGQHFPVTVYDKDETSITFDANHELAGKALNFKIEMVEIA